MEVGQVLNYHVTHQIWEDALRLMFYLFLNQKMSALNILTVVHKGVTVVHKGVTVVHKGVMRVDYLIVLNNVVLQLTVRLTYSAVIITSCVWIQLQEVHKDLIVKHIILMDGVKMAANMI